MLETTKEIVIALINKDRLVGVDDVKLAIKEIYEEVLKIKNS